MIVSNDSRRRISVAGDVTIDWSIARAAHESHAFPSPGGAALLGGLLRALVTAIPGGAEISVSAPDVSPNEMNPANARVHHRYSAWELCGVKQDSAWRMSAFLGVRRSAAVANGKSPSGPADMILIDDSALGFRDEPSQWPELSGDP